MDPPASPLKIPIFRAIWAASLLSNFGTVIQAVGAAWLMASLTGSSQLVALVHVSMTLPIMLFALLAGAAADNLGRRNVMLVSQWFMLAVSSVFTACAFAGLVTPWLVLLATFLIGCGAAINGPAWHTSVGDIVPRSALPSAVALNSMTFNLARSAGPAAGGAIVAWAGAAAAFLANTLSYIGLIVVLIRWRPALPSNPLPREKIGGAMAAGVRYLAMSPELQVVLVRGFLVASGAGAVPALLPLVVRDTLNGGAFTYGMLLGIYGIGAVTGALMIGYLRQRTSKETIVRCASVALATGAAAIALSRELSIIVPGLALSGAGWILVMATLNATAQMTAPRWVVARVLALYQMAAFGGLAAGSSLFGATADWLNLGAALLAAAVWQLLGNFSMLRWPLPEMEELNLDPLNRWTEPETSSAVHAHSGPVIITIEYRVAHSDIPQFLAAMSERRRIRRRDGARQWSLLRDLAEEDLWVEHYRLPTWLDFVRHNQRRTKADAANLAGILNLHLGPDKPVVRRRIEVKLHLRQAGSGEIAGHVGDLP